MELTKAEEEKVVILLTDFNRKLDLILAAQAALINKVEHMSTAKNATKESH
ncbi:MAG: hypothetical protein U1D97_15915 [Desulfuromonadales bacterium]|nr:hypothetical protein [Desulfuromonadales bacterium]